MENLSDILASYCCLLSFPPKAKIYVLWTEFCAPRNHMMKP